MKHACTSQQFSLGSGPLNMHSKGLALTPFTELCLTLSSVLTQPTTTRTVTECCAALCGDTRGQLGVKQRSVSGDQAGWSQTLITLHLFPCGNLTYYSLVLDAADFL